MPPKLRRLLSRTILAGLLVGMGSAPASALRVAAYNVLNYPSNVASTREPAFRTLLLALDPDVLVTTEMQSDVGVNQFLNNVLLAIQPGQWAVAPFVNGPDTDPALFYKPSRVTFVDEVMLTTALRNIGVYRVRLAGYESAAAEVRLFSMHLKASMGFEQDRLAEATIARNYANGFAAGTNFIYCGDLNVYTSTEPAYQKFLEDQVDNDGRAKDPINRPGAWNNNGTFAAVHTQSTRTGLLTPGDGGATGGLDDRFDHLIISYGLDDGEGVDWIPGTYKAFGNDGNHFNQDINAGTNGVVSQDVANALQRASDHLPVAVDLQAPALAQVSPATLDFGTVIVGAAVVESVQVTNVAAVPADELDYGVTAPGGFTSAPGPFQLLPSAIRTHMIDLDTSTPGARAGDLSVSSDDPEQAVRTVGLSGHVLDHAQPSLDPASAVTAAEYDWGVQSAGGFVPHTFALYDFGYGPDQALLEVSTIDVQGGDGRFTVTPPPGDPITVGADSAQFSVAFQDSGATTDSAYEATVTVASQDESGVPGGSARPPVVLTVRATLGSGPVAIDDGAQPTRTRLRLTWPNPVADEMRVRFDLAHATEVRADLFDAQGRWIAAVARGGYPAGRHEVGWSATGRNASLRGGVYFLRFAADGVVELRRVVLLPGASR